MIALPDKLPLVRHGGRYEVPLRREWLDNSLQSAANAAGYHQWWLVHHITEGVSNFLGEHHHSSVITTDEVESTIRRILNGIGYSEVANRLALSPPPVEIPLPMLAERAATELVELSFFQALDEEISYWLQQGAHNIRFSGLKYSVKKLLNVHRWQKACHSLRQEILHFLDERMKSAQANSHFIAFTIS